MALDLMGVYQAFRGGEDAARKNRLADVAEQARFAQGAALTGNKQAQTDLSTLDPQAAMQTDTYLNEKQKGEMAEFLSAAYTAKTPEAYKSVVDRFRAKGHEFGPGEDLWENRESVLREGMSVADQMGFDWRKAESAREQGNANRAYSLQRDELAETKRYHTESLAAKDQTSDLQEYNFALQQGFKGSFVDFKHAMKSGNELSVTLPDGTTINQGPSKITEGQGKDMGYLNRMTSSLPTIDKHENALLSFGEGAAGALPLGAGNYLKSSEYQQAEQAGNNFLTALLRKESGATVPPAEQKSYGAIFLPQPGDKKEVIAQKREARRQAAIGVKMGLTAPLIASMIQQGVDFSALDPSAANASGKADQGFTNEEVEREIQRRGLK